MFTKSYKVYGREGHRQRESFSPSYVFDVEGHKTYICTVEVYNADQTGTNEYSLVKITAPSEVLCDAQLMSQIDDGIFECSNVGKVVVVNE